MKKFICVLCAVALFLLPGCSENTDEIANKTGSLDKIQGQESYIWEEIPKYKEVSEHDEVNADASLKKTLEIQKAILGVDDIFTDNIRESMINIINGWYNEKFYSVKHIDKSQMIKLEVKDYQTSVVYCEDKPFIRVCFTTSAITASGPLGGESINVLIDVSGEEYSVYKMWFEAKYRYQNTF